MARGRDSLLREIRGAVGRGAEIEYGMKEFLQGLLVGFILGFLIATQLVR
jgi:hypothetical protein